MNRQVDGTWAWNGNGRKEADRAIEACTRDHGGRLTGPPTVFGPLALDPKDGRPPVEITLLIVEEDADGWWDEWCTVHKWLRVQPGWLDQLY